MSTASPVCKHDVYAMIRGAAVTGILTARTGGHALRATEITAYMKNNGKLEVAQQIANDESPRTRF